MKKQSISFMSWELASEFGEDFERIKNIRIGKEIYYAACEVCDVLGIKSAPYAVNKYVQRENRTLWKIPEINSRRSVHVINIYGIYCLICLAKTAKRHSFIENIPTKVVTEIIDKYKKNDTKKRQKKETMSLERFF